MLNRHQRIAIAALAIGTVATSFAALAWPPTRAADVGIVQARCKVLMCPMDLRVEGATVDTTGMPAWISEVYAELREELGRLP